MTIDINCDLGEGMESDADVMAYITSCNIACGGHAGDAKSMADTIKLAQKHHVKIGAHPAFPDRKNFGRKVMEMPPEKLVESLRSQLKSFQDILTQSNAALHHIKPHGALYNLAAKDAGTASLLVALIKTHYPEVIVYAPYGSVMAKIAKENGLEVWHEVFADRNYHEDLSLVSRDDPEALIHNTKDAVSHLANMVITGKVQTLSGKMIPIEADTVCVHGDSRGALALTKAIHETMKSAN
ncbi:5-oxoprolinase subunit PxpA [Echinicola vietnamensis]|uniref:Putative lactam utilization protein B-like protein n=1 Tax=Echinicola vietnamensis (strain DSM 17526 / LMG 23754 / KMM 6221) TaxID=926556 RepID=L0G1R1_ECHVK|nr:5-oxoprolinase subunit PxpA [Echinicola vietnamensis]AGA79248.1 putative lactam utilization protein B-like protein [Echinicola vietnamensis DSM 17526]